MGLNSSVSMLGQFGFYGSVSGFKNQNPKPTVLLWFRFGQFFSVTRFLGSVLLTPNPHNRDHLRTYINHPDFQSLNEK